MDLEKSKWQDSIAWFISSFAYVYTYTWFSLVAQVVKNLPAMWETGVQSLGQGEIFWRRGDNPLQYSCLEGYSPWGCKELDTCVCVCVCVMKHISDVSLDSLEEHTNSVTWRVRLGRSVWVCVCVWWNIYLMWAWIEHTNSVTWRVRLGRSVCVCVSVCEWVCVCVCVWDETYIWCELG